MTITFGKNALSMLFTLTIAILWMAPPAQAKEQLSCLFAWTIEDDFFADCDAYQGEFTLLAEDNISITQEFRSLDRYIHATLIQEPTAWKEVDMFYSAFLRKCVGNSCKKVQRELSEKVLSVLSCGPKISNGVFGQLLSESILGNNELSKEPAFYISRMKCESDEIVTVFRNSPYKGNLGRVIFIISNNGGQ